MSVIYRTLRKIKAKPDEEALSGGKLKSRRDVYTFTTVLFSPVVLIGIALVAAAIYMGIVLALPYFTPPVRDSGTSTAPASPGSFPVEPADSGEPSAPLPHWRDTLPSAENDQTPESIAPVPENNGPTEKTPSYMPPLSQDQTASGAQPTDPEDKAVALAQNVEVEESTDKEETPKPAAPIQKRRQVSRGQPGAGITQLVADIQQAMQKGDEKKAEHLVNRLARIKGKNHPFVLKMRAFMDIHKGRYDSASARLQKVLEKNKNDLEAGINMAIVEIKTGRLEEARARLTRLIELYPENETAYELLQKLR